MKCPAVFNSTEFSSIRIFFIVVACTLCAYYKESLFGLPTKSILGVQIHIVIRYLHRLKYNLSRKYKTFLDASSRKYNVNYRLQEYSIVDNHVSLGTKLCDFSLSTTIAIAITNIINYITISIVGQTSFLINSVGFCFRMCKSWQLVRIQSLHTANTVIVVRVMNTNQWLIKQNKKILIMIFISFFIKY